MPVYKAVILIAGPQKGTRYCMSNKSYPFSYSDMTKSKLKVKNRRGSRTCRYCAAIKLDITLLTTRI